MAVERRWVYESIVAPGEADGRICRLCGQAIADGHEAGLWLLKAVEDVAHSDFVAEYGYTHYGCTQAELAKAREDPYHLPEVPDIPHP